MSEATYFLSIPLTAVAAIPGRPRRPEDRDRRTGVAGVDMSGVKHVPDDLTPTLAVRDSPYPRVVTPE
jgi:hypothetical protein